jgi:hypothetical protein
MAMAAGAAVFLVLLIGIGGGLLLYWLVRAERTDRDVMSRDEAERAARRDSPDDEPP